MDKAKIYNCIEAVEVYKAFYDIIDDAGNWYFDDEVPKEAVTHYIDGVTEMARRMLKLFEAEEPKGIVFPERNTICDNCTNLQVCMVDGDMVDVRLPGNKFPHYKPTSLWTCPLGKIGRLPFEPDEDEEEGEEEGEKDGEA